MRECGGAGICPVAPARASSPGPAGRSAVHRNQCEPEWSQAGPHPCPTRRAALAPTPRLPALCLKFTQSGRSWRGDRVPIFRGRGGLTTYCGGGLQQCTVTRVICASATAPQAQPSAIMARMLRFPPGKPRGRRSRSRPTVREGAFGSFWMLRRGGGDRQIQLIQAHMRLNSPLDQNDPPISRRLPDSPSKYARSSTAAANLRNVSPSRLSPFQVAVCRSWLVRLLSIAS